LQSLHLYFALDFNNRNTIYEYALSYEAQVAATCTSYAENALDFDALTVFLFALFA